MVTLDNHTGREKFILYQKYAGYVWKIAIHFYENLALNLYSGENNIFKPL